jgi:hypothetical protein
MASPGRRPLTCLTTRLPNPAVVLASVALFVALTGGAIAAGQAIPPRAKFADKAGFAAKAGIAANALKLNGKTAAQIVASVPAPAPPTSIASYASSVAVNYSLNPTAEQNVTAACPAGSKAMGGGFSNPSSALVLSAGSSPTADGAGWVEDLVNISPSTAGAGQVFVTCIK